MSLLDSKAHVSPCSWPWQYQCHGRPMSVPETGRIIYAQELANAQSIWLEWQTLHPLMFKETIASQRSDSPVANIWLLYIWLLSLQEDHYSLPKCSSTSRFVPLPEGTGDLEEDFIFWNSYTEPGPRSFWSFHVSVSVCISSLLFLEKIGTNEGLLLQQLAWDYSFCAYNKSRHLFFCATYWKDMPGRQELAWSKTVSGQRGVKEKHCHGF